MLRRMLKVYGFAKVNAMARGRTRDLRVLWALEEMQLPFEIVGMDHPAHDLSTAAYRELSPFEQIPAIDDDGLVLSESAAILLYLAKKSGRLGGRTAAEEAQVVRWCFAALTTVELPLVNSVMIDWTSAPGDCALHREFMTGWVHRALGNLDRWLDGRAYVATEEFTVADVLLAHVLDVVPKAALLQPHARVREYRDRCLARPAWKRAHARYCERVEAG